MKWGMIIAGAATALITAQAQASLQVETAPFIIAPIAQMDFEALGSQTVVVNTPYSEGGVTIQYVFPDAAARGYGGAWVAGEGIDLGGGTHGWYAVNYGGYSSVRLSSGAAFNEIQFSAASGGSDTGALDALQYSLWLGGSEVATGATGPLHYLGQGSSTFGFSGLMFDEVRVRNDSSITYYAVTRSDTLALDNIVIGNRAPAVPEPATWALMTIAFGLVGGMLRRGPSGVQMSRVEFRFGR